MSKTALHIVLVEPVIPWNTGNVGRTCVAIGAQLHLVEPLGFLLDDKHVKRAGLDYWQHVSPKIWPSWAAFEEALPELGEPYFFTAEAKNDLWTPEYPENVVLVFGSETEGLPQDLRQRYADRLVSLPMEDGPIRSLNLSTAAAVAAFEVLRQRS